MPPGRDGGPPVSGDAGLAFRFDLRRENDYRKCDFPAGQHCDRRFSADFLRERLMLILDSHE
jgi:hypothetical protein